jgi:AcrR family transcriptional regulator
MRTSPEHPGPNRRANASRSVRIRPCFENRTPRCSIRDGSVSFMCYGVSMVPDPASVPAVAPPRGRPRDPARDEAILDATIDLLVEEGYDRLTIEQVAHRAGAGTATVYRRWSSKADLVLDAVTRIKPGGGPVDTGTLEGDIERLTSAVCSKPSALANQVMCAVASSLPREPELLAAFRDRFIEPRIRRIESVLERARDRGEIADTVDIPLAASLVPSLMLQQMLLNGRPAGREYAHRIVDHVLRPTLGIAVPTTATRENS